MMPTTERETSLTLSCVMCGNPVTIWFDIADWNEWCAGAYIHDVMPYLSAGEREMLISQTCDNCWKNLFSDLDNE